MFQPRRPCSTFCDSATSTIIIIFCVSVTPIMYYFVFQPRQQCSTLSFSKAYHVLLLVQAPCLPPVVLGDLCLHELPAGQRVSVLGRNGENGEAAAATVRRVVGGALLLSPDALGHCSTARSSRGTCRPTCSR